MEELLHILKQDDLESLEKWISNGSNFDLRDEDGNCALHLVGCHAISHLQKLSYQSERWKQQSNIYFDLILKWQKSGRDLNTLNNDNATAAHYILQYADIQDADTIPYRIYETLVTRESINLVEQRERATVLHLAVRRRQWAITEMLLLKGPDLNLVDCRGQTALMVELEREGANTSIAECLITNTNVNIADHNGNTPLHAAILYEYDDAAKFCLYRKADVTLRNHAGVSPAHLMPHDYQIGRDPQALPRRRYRRRRRYAWTDTKALLMYGSMCALCRNPDDGEDVIVRQSLEQLLMFCSPKPIKSFTMDRDYLDENSLLWRVEFESDLCILDLPNFSRGYESKVLYLLLSLCLETGGSIVSSECLEMFEGKENDTDNFALAVNEVWKRCNIQDSQVPKLTKLACKSIRRCVGVPNSYVNPFMSLGLPAELSSLVSFQDIANDLYYKWKSKVPI